MSAVCVCLIVCFKQKTAYEMRISDWSSDVCSSDLKAFDIGLRINPEHREGEVEKYDPCQSHSRLGRPISQLRASDLEGVSGLHFHTLCEQDFLPLDRTWAAVEPLIQIGRAHV